MYPYIVKQIMTYLEIAKESVKPNMENLNKLQTAMNPSELAELTKASMDVAKYFSELFAYTIRECLLNQIKMANLQTSAGSGRELSELYIGAATELFNKHKEMIGAYTGSVVKYLDELSRANEIMEIVAVQTNVLAEIKEKAKSGMMDTGQILSSISVATEDWMKNTLDTVNTGKNGN